MIIKLSPFISVVSRYLIDSDGNKVEILNCEIIITDDRLGNSLPLYEMKVRLEIECRVIKCFI